MLLSAFVARVLIESGDVDAVVVLGAVIRGETTHYEIVSQGCAQGIMQVQIATGIPIGLGILTVENMDQAVARSEAAGGHNVGEESNVAAIEMALPCRTNPSIPAKVRHKWFGKHTRRHLCAHGEVWLPVTYGLD